MVIENHPRLDGEPFPTLYWLTCPILVTRASRLESEGALREFESHLSADPELEKRLVFALNEYRTRRDAHEVLDPVPPAPGGGPQRVKCLHAHLAHELVSSCNPVGAWTLARTGWPDCREPCVKS